MNSGTQNEACRTSTTWRSFWPCSDFGSKARKAPKSSGSNFLVGVNCHRIGPELVAQLQHARLQEALDGLAGLRQHAPVGGVAHALHGEHAIARASLAHLAKVAGDCVR
jgi:hypothetical protein